MASSSARPANVGIVASYLHFPKQFVSQASLEKLDGVSAGKYTQGLGQTEMAFCGPREDTTAHMLTAVSELLKRYNLSYQDIGRLEVGTESLVDKSKSAKTALMSLFHDNTSLEGVTSVNACYGGTAALLHTVDWVESSAWDGRYGLVVCGDVAVYEKGPARPTGGAGVAAILVGPNAPLVLESRLRATHMEDVYDFYKPRMGSEYPIVDGKLSNSCYLRAIDVCYERFARKFERDAGRAFSLEKDVDHAVFHLPYTKLVQKSFARMAFADSKRSVASKYADKLSRFAALPMEESYTHKELEKTALEASLGDYQAKVFPSTLAGRRIGNIYTGSLYAGLCSLIAQSDDSFLGNRALMFSYGSGLAATLFSLRVDKSLKDQKDACDLLRRLDHARIEASATDYDQTMLLRENEWKLSNFTPSVHPCERLEPGAYYLARVDELHRRSYERVPHALPASQPHAKLATTLSVPTSVAGVARARGMCTLAFRRLLA